METVSNSLKFEIVEISPLIGCVFARFTFRSSAFVLLGVLEMIAPVVVLLDGCSFKGVGVVSNTDLKQCSII